MNRELLSVLQSSREHEPEHAKVADERPPRMSEGRWLIAFNEKVTGPGETVADWNPEQSPDVMASCDGPHEHGQAKQSPTSVQKTVPCARMLLEIEREEFVVGRETLSCWLCHSLLSELRLLAANSRWRTASSAFGRRDGHCGQR
jgi:hypothetical protein